MSRSATDKPPTRPPPSPGPMAPPDADTSYPEPTTLHSHSPGTPQRPRPRPPSPYPPPVPRRPRTTLPTAPQRSSTLSMLAARDTSPDPHKPRGLLQGVKLLVASMPRATPKPAKQSSQSSAQPEAVNHLWLIKAVAFTILAALLCGYLTLCLLFYHA